MTRKEKEVFRRQFYLLMAMMTIVGFIGWNTPFKCLLVFPAFVVGVFAGFLLWVTARTLFANLLSWGFVALTIYQVIGNLPAPSMATVVVTLPGVIGSAFMSTALLGRAGENIADLLFGFRL